MRLSFWQRGPRTVDNFERQVGMRRPPSPFRKMITSSYGPLHVLLYPLMIGKFKNSSHCLLVMTLAK